jgi:copper chaperone CopZ
MMLARKLDHGAQAICGALPIDTPVSSRPLAQAATVFLLVRGMDCPACTLRVRNALLHIEGVMAADVALNRGLAKVWYDAKRVQPETLAAQLPTLADDAMHHYTAQLIIVSGEIIGGDTDRQYAG